MRSRFRIATVVALTSVGLLAGAIRADAQAVFVALVAGKCQLTADIGLPVIGPNKGTSIGASCKFGSDATKAGELTKPSVLVARQIDLAKNNVSKPKNISVTCVQPGGPCDGGASLTAVVGPSDLGGPWCGHSAGSFSGSFGNVSISGTYISGGGTLLLTGTIVHGLQAGPLVGAVNALSDLQKQGIPPVGNSCIGGTARRFYVVGGIVGVKIGPLFTK